MKRMGMWLAIMALLLLVPVSAVMADGPGVFTDGGRIFVDEDVSLESEETFHGDLGVFDGDLSVPAGSRVEGDVFVTNGDADIEGQIDGSLAVINGDLCVCRSGQVDGDVFGMSGDQEMHYTLMAIVSNEAFVQQCVTAIETIVGDLDEPNTGVLAAWPLVFVKGVPRG